MTGVVLAIDGGGGDLKLDGTATTSAPILIGSTGQTLEIGPNATLTIDAAESIAGGTIQLDGGTLIDPDGITLGAGATLAGFGVVDSSVMGSGGTVVANGGILDLAGSLVSVSGPQLAVDPNSDLKLENTATTGPVTLNATETLEIGFGRTVTINGTETVTGGNIQLDGGTLIDTSGIAITSGTLNGWGTVIAPLRRRNGRCRRRHA